MQLGFKKKNSAVLAKKKLSQWLYFILLELICVSFLKLSAFKRVSASHGRCFGIGISKNVNNERTMLEGKSASISAT